MTSIPLIQRGSVEIHRIEETRKPMFPVQEFFAEMDPAGDKIAALGRDDYDHSENQLVMSSCSYLVRDGEHTVLIDTGIGNNRTRVRPIFHNLDTMWWKTLTGLTDPNDVDFVICTHLHVDHVGWNTHRVGDSWVPSFPNARYLFNRVEYEFIQGPARERIVARNGNYLADAIAPVVDAGLSDLIEPPHQVSPSVSVEAAPGDTPGHLVVRVADPADSETIALVTGDAFHHVLQISDPSLSSRFSELPHESEQTRRRLFEESAQAGTPLLAGHIASHEIVRVVRSHGGFALGGPHFPAGR